MKKKIVIILSIVVFLAAAFLVYDHFYTVYQREHRVVTIPTGTVQYFDMETEKVIRIFEARSNSLDDLSESDKEFVQGYLDNYVNNPRLSDQQDRICTDILLMEVFYSSYIENKDGARKKEIKETNEAIESFFSILKRLQSNVITTQ
ncbi:hypothetical protein D3C74_216170 [compost metagenome]